MIAAALRNSARALLAVQNPTVYGPQQPSIGVNPSKCLPKLCQARNIISGPPARRFPLTTKIGFFVFFFLFLMVPELAMLTAIPNHAGTSIQAIQRRLEEEEARRVELEGEE